MAIDRAHIGFCLPPYTHVVSADAVGAFADAIGAATASHPASLPTFLKVIEGLGNSSRAILEALDVDLRRIVHVEQEFSYGEPIRIGDSVTVMRCVCDVLSREDSANEVLVIDSTVTSGCGALIGRSRQSLLVRADRTSTA
jgi:hypothetical protein